MFQPLSTPTEPLLPPTPSTISSDAAMAVPPSPPLSSGVPGEEASFPADCGAAALVAGREAEEEAIRQGLQVREGEREGAKAGEKGAQAPAHKALLPVPLPGEATKPMPHSRWP